MYPFNFTVFVSIYTSTGNELVFVLFYIPTKTWYYWTFQFCLSHKMVPHCNLNLHFPKNWWRSAYSHAYLLCKTCSWLLVIFLFLCYCCYVYRLLIFCWLYMLLSCCSSWLIFSFVYRCYFEIQILIIVWCT